MTFKNSTKPNGVAYVRFQQPEDCKVALEYLQQPEKEEKKDDEEIKDSDKKEYKDEEEGAVKEKKKDGDKKEEKNQTKGTWIDGKIITVEILEKKYPDEDPI